VLLAPRHGDRGDAGRSHQEVLDALAGPFSASASDNDGANGLTTRFIILNANGSTAYDSASSGTSVITGGQRNDLRGWTPEAANAWPFW
jgi:hypothetical protein